MLLNYILMLGNVGVFSFLRSWKLNPLSHHLSECNFIQNLDFLRFFVYLWDDSNEFFFKSLHIIFIMYIEIDSLQHIKISRQTYPMNLSKICVTTFTVLTLCTWRTYGRQVSRKTSRSLSQLVILGVYIRRITYDSATVNISEIKLTTNKMKGKSKSTAKRCFIDFATHVILTR